MRYTAQRSFYIANTYLFIFLVLGTTNCGKILKTKENANSETMSSDTISTSQKSFNFTVEDAQKLPKCDSNNESALVYVKKLAVFNICHAGVWEIIDLKGAKGDTGEKGNDGKNGLDGKNGNDGSQGERGLSTFIEAQVWQAVWKENLSKVGFIQVTYTSKLNSSCTAFIWGTGFVVGTGLVATNGHVVKDSFSSEAGASKALCSDGSTAVDLKRSKVSIYFPSDEAGSITSTTSSLLATQVDLSIASSDDLALIFFPTLSQTPVTLSLEDEANEANGIAGVKLTDHVMLIGYSLALHFAQATTGRINGIQKIEKVLQNINTPTEKKLLQDGRIIYLYDLLSTSGSSGGPIFNSEGKVIGINFAEFTSDSNLEYGFAIQVKHLRNFLPKPRIWNPIAL